MPDCIFSLSKTTSAPPESTEIGGKAANLIQLMAFGFKVPDGAVLSVQAFDYHLTENGLAEDYALALSTRNEKTLHEIREKIIKADLPGKISAEIHEYLKAATEKGVTRFAVRSSGLAEDLGDASFAGLYHTHLNAMGIDQVCNAIKSIWASSLEERVFNYMDKNRIPSHKLKMAVIVQELITSDKSGVAFSVNPITGQDQEVLVEACWGLGEALVSGEITPDRYRYQWFDECELECNTGENHIIMNAAHNGGVETVENHRPQDRVLSELELASLCQQVADIQACYGFPVDIEWAIQDQTVFILQARPITQIHYTAFEEEWTTADFKDGGVSSTVCTPFMWSLYDYIWETTLPNFLNSVHLLLSHQKETLWGKMFFGRPYWNLGQVKQSYAQLPGYVERSFDEDLGIEVCYQGLGETTRLNPQSLWKGLRMLKSFSGSLQKHLSTLESFKQNQANQLASLSEVNYQAFNQAQRFQHFTNFIQNDYFNSEAKYFIHIFHTSIATSLFKEFYRKTHSPVSFINLISGLQNVSHLKLNEAIEQVAQKIANDQNTKTFWQNASLQSLMQLWKENTSEYCLPELRQLVDQYRYHSTRELDITVPRYGEDPSFILNSIQDSLRQDAFVTPGASHNEPFNKFQEAQAAFLKHLPFWKRKKAAKQLQELRHILWWREELRDLSTQYYYFVRKFSLAIADDFITMGIIKDPEDIFWLDKNEWIAVIEGKLAQNEAKQLWHKRKRYYDGFRNFSNPNEIGKRFQQPESAAQHSGTIFSGVACSPGVVVGKVKVIQDIFDANRIEHGDILITRYTDPGWTPKFSLISAVATETGGVLSHAAVISREYGIPAVLAIKHLTRSLRDGDLIRIDGEAGTLEVLEKS